MQHLMLHEVAPADAPIHDFRTRLSNLQIEIWQIEAERQRLGVVLRIRRAARQQLQRQYRSALARATT